MPAKSKKQQRFFGLVKSIQEGKAHGSGKAEEAAASMSKKDVSDFAGTSRKGLPEKKSNSQELNFLLGLAAASALTGAGLGAFAGGARDIRDITDLGATRRKKYESRAALPLSHRLREDGQMEAAPVDASRMLPEGSPESDLSEEERDDVANEAALKQSSWLGDRVGGFAAKNILHPALYGAALPIALVAPGAASFLLTKRMLDRRREKQLSDEVEQAKKEFEEALNVPLSKISADLSDLAMSSVKRSSVDRAPAVDASKRPGRGLLGNLAYAALGVPTGVGALIGWKLMQDRMENDPDKRKLKELNALLRRETAAKVLEGGIDLENEGDSIRFRL